MHSVVKIKDSLWRIAPYQQPDPDKAAQLKLHAYLMPLLGGTSWEIKQIEEAIRLDQVNA